MRAWPLLLVAACDFTTNPGTPNVGDGGTDGRVDAALVYMDAPHTFDDAMVAASMCFGQQGQTGYYFCVGSLPTQALMFNNDQSINTDRCPGVVVTLTGPNQQACVVLGAGVTVAQGKTVNAYGSAPLVIASTMDMMIEGTIDVSSPQNGRPGAAGDDSGCNNGGLGGQFDFNGGGGGGAGGSFGTAAGNGGNGDGGAGGGGANMAVGTNRLRGGCHGGFGGDGYYFLSGGGYGYGGGAVWLVARNNITISANGVINASGEGGSGGGKGKAGNGGGGGGGGGGSGGMILFDAGNNLMIMGKVVANGGGGGGGGDSGGGGSSGSSPSASSPSSAASGGSSNGNGGNGGNGATKTSGGSGGVDANGGTGAGGGAGGGVGLVEAINATVSGSNNISPPVVRI